MQIANGETRASRDRPHVFIAYPSEPPLLKETVGTAAKMLAGTGIVHVVRWEDLQVSGRFVINEILTTIDESALSVFILTNLNHNVMFELGYAIGAQRRIWLALDDSHEPTRQAWDQISVLSTVGYSRYHNAEDIVARFMADQPHHRQDTLFERMIAPQLQPAGKQAIFYVKSLYENEPERMLTRRASREVDKGYRYIVADAREATYPLTWYAQQVYSASAVLVHLTSPDQVGALTHNARSSLIAGLAVGMKRPLLMLAQNSLRSPIDYKDLLVSYSTSRQALQSVGHWLDSTLPPLEDEPTQPPLRLATELAGLRLGEDVAEHEQDELHEYFVDTAGYREALSAKTTIFLGRKGTGKTANFIRASEALAEDKRNLVVAIKPWGYDMQAVVRLLSKPMPRDVRSYLIEGLWQYLLETEVALAALEDARARPAGIATDSAEWSLQQYCEDPKLGINEDFAIRLERMVNHLEALDIEGESVEASRQALLSALYSGPIADLRRLLGAVLRDRNRVAVLIDNLDRGWDRATDVAQLSEMFLGLIVSSQKLQREFSKKRPDKARIELTLAIFLRSDIFFQLKKQAREPDKLPASTLTWGNPELLLRVLGERFVVSQGGQRTAREVWDLFFPQKVKDQLTPRYLLSRVLPRPRDLLHLCTDSIQSAITAGHNRVLERDVLEGEKAYSSFACDALRVEAGDALPQLEDILYGFAGASAIQTYPDVLRLLNRAGVPDDQAATVVEQLKTLSFLGIEVEDGVFRYAEDTEDARRIAAMAQRYGEAGHPGRLEVHPAFRTYLEVSE